MPEHSNHVAVIGLGAMGLPMAVHLATGFPVTGFDPLEARRDLAAERNLAVAGTPAEASKSADIALLAVRDHTQAHSALFGADGALETLRHGSPVILTSTVGPEAARALAGESAGGFGGPVLGHRHRTRQGHRWWPLAPSGPVRVHPHRVAHGS